MTKNRGRPSSKQNRLSGIMLGLSLAVLTLGGACCALVLWRGNLPYVTLRSVPVLPGADIQFDGRQSDWRQFYLSDPLAEIIYRIDRPWPEVVEFYRTEMVKQGWVLQKEDSIDIKGGPADTYYHVVCLVFRRAPIFVVNVGASGTVKKGVVLSDTVVTVDTAPSNQAFCE